MLNKKYVPLLLGGGGGGPSLRSSIKQKLTLTSDPSSPQPWLTVTDSLSFLTLPTIDGSGDLVQSAVDGFFDDGVNRSVYNSDVNTIEAKTFANLLVHYYNTNGSNGLWGRKISDTVWKFDQYVFGTEFTEFIYNRNVQYYGKGGGALRDVSGDLILDGSGYVQFVQYEQEYKDGSDILIPTIILPPEIIL